MLATLGRMDLGRAPVWRELDRDARRVLVTDGASSGQGRSALAATRAASVAGEAVLVGVSGRRQHSLAASSRACSAAVPLPLATEPGYAAAVRAAAAGCLTVLPASDAALLALGAPVEHLIDKQQLHARAQDAGVPVPSTVIVGRGEDPGELPVPAMVKSAVKAGVADVPVRRAETVAEIREACDRGPVVVQPLVPGPITAVAGVVVGGRFQAVVHQRYERTWPVEAGTACSAVTVAPDADAEAGLLRLLEGYEGIVQAQFVGGLLIDVNPRVYGSLPLAVAAGANLVGAWCDALRGRTGPPRRARPGVAYRWIEGDLRHVLTQTRAGSLSLAEAARVLRPRRGSAHSVVSLRDLGPALARFRYAATRGEA